MDNQILKRVNSCIKARKEITEAFGNKISLIADQSLASCDDRFSAGRLFFLTILKTLKQHTLQNLIIHSALYFDSIGNAFYLIQYPASSIKHPVSSIFVNPSTA